MQVWYADLDDPQDVDLLLGLWRAMCRLQHLTTLCIPSETIHALSLQHKGQAPPSGMALPSGLRMLKVRSLPLHGPPGDLAWLLRAGWVPHGCRVVWGAPSGALQLEDALAVTAHPGGVSMYCTSTDAQTDGADLAPCVLPVHGMLPINSVPVLQALDAAGSTQPTTTAGGEGPNQQQGPGQQLLDEQGASQQQGSGKQQQQRGPRPLLEALYVPLDFLSQASSLECLQPGPYQSQPSRYLSQLRTLALGLSGSDPQPALAAVQGLLEAGQLPALEALLLHHPPWEMDDVGKWGPGLVKVLHTGQRQGLVAQVLLTHTMYPAGGCRALERLKEQVPDPDCLLLGLRAGAWDAEFLPYMH